MRYPCRFDIARGLGNGDLENWFGLGRGVREMDFIFDGSQNRWADSYNSVLIHTENLTVDPVYQGTEFILQAAVHI